MAELVPVEPFDIVIFGATGDLARRKLIPALFHRWCDGQIPENSRIIGVARDELTDAEFHERAAEFGLPDGASEQRRERWAEFIAHVRYIAADIEGESPGWAALKDALDPNEDKIRIFYLALPPSIYGKTCAAIGAHGLNTRGSRVILEKPIGRDYHSARLINEAVGAVFPENSIFRIDHYLGKETVQNLLILRFANMLLEPVWSAGGIDHVQITVAESLGAGTRASYYDRSGALRDMVQNHILQLLCLVAMEPPASLEADAVRAEKLKVLRALRLIKADQAGEAVVRGQYQAGISDGASAPAYAEEVGEESKTETFVAIRADIDNWRWAGVPFYLRTGKRMRARRSEIIIQFKPVPHDIINADAGVMQPNRLVIRLQPDEGVKLMMMTKDPGPGGVRLRYVPLNLSYAETFDQDYPDAYERLLMAVVRGNLGLFMRRDEVEAAWRWTDAVVAAWTDGACPLQFYPAGSDGPDKASLLLSRDGREWYDAERP
ncbi:MAG: glucose-6-phosphate dehydrogenase [Alphaproteobacteria bacterium]|nr:glucose-6-phosphate dehydrogenase [Alphaproteobacteria bacterium]